MIPAGRAAPDAFPPGAAGPRGVAPSAARSGTIRSGARAVQPRWLAVLGGLAITILVVTVGAGAYLVVRGDRAPAAPTGHDISSQQLDPEPLTKAEVFPSKKITPDPAGKPYPVVKSQISDDCTTGAVGNLATDLSDQGCTQVVRATLWSPDKSYVLTAGLFNLPNSAAVGQVADAIRPAVQAKKGRLTGLDAGGKASVITRSPTQLGWDTEGHFLAYCVVARADGKQIQDDDPAVGKIINDLVEDQLKGTVLAARVHPRPSASPAKPSPSPN